MASTLSLRSKIQDDHLTCTVCFDNFVQPKALPCLHTFCQDCLQDYVFGRCYDSEGEFPCPICRESTPIPAGGVAYFPDNHLVNSLSDTVTHSRRPPNIPPRPPRCPPDSTKWVNASTKTPRDGATAAPPVRLIYPNLSALTPHEEVTDIPPSLPPRESNNACTRGLALRFGKYGSSFSDFLQPNGLAVTSAGEFIISDAGGNRIIRYDRLGNLKGSFACSKCVVKGVTVTSNDDLLVSVTGAGSDIMQLYNQHGTFLSTHGGNYLYETPHGITYLRNGYVAVTGLASQTVLVFTDKFKYSSTIGRKGSGDGRFLAPCHVTSDNKNQVIVSDRANHNIQIFTHTGKFKERFGGEGSNHGYLNTPLGVDVNMAGQIIVADSNNGRVEVFSPKGRYLASVVTDTFEIAPDVKPIDVAVTRDNQCAILLVGPQFAEVRVYKAELLHRDSPDGCKHQ